jgi:predicted nucleotidyltransferase/DNA-binding XRE family transcriptional regulator
MAEDVFAHRLRTRRLAAGLTQRRLAEVSGVKQPLISALERGTRQPTEAVRSALEDALRVRPSAVLRVTRDRVADLVHATGATGVWVYGSIARGEDRPGSDVDLLVEFPPDADIVTLLTLEDELARLLTVPVDVISTGGTSRLLENARAEAVLL